MSSKEFRDPKKVHFIGIGGIGMSALARLYLHDRATVSGSDASESDNTRRLAEEGATISYAQVPENIVDGLDLVIYTEAMPPDHPELVAARERGIETINYFEALARFANAYYLIAVAGTHGKTTTTAMLTDVFEAAEKDPTAIVGSLRTKTKSNFRPGKSKYAIVEACEYRRDFLHLTPDVLVITNLEHEHVDYYPDLAAVQAAFRELIERVHDTGVVVTDPADPNIAPILEGCPVPVIDYKQHLDLTLPLQQPGLHNRLNAAAALAVAAHEKLDRTVAKAALTDFAGTWRRFERKGEVNGAHVIDDYGHHPTEIRATLAGARELFPEAHLTVLFQPHTVSRTRELFDEFAKAFRGADRVLLAPIYAAREETGRLVSSRELAVRTIEYCRDAHYVPSLAAAEADLRAHAKPGDVILVMGAGDVTTVATALTAPAGTVTLSAETVPPKEK